MGVLPGKGFSMCMPEGDYRNLTFEHYDGSNGFGKTVWCNLLLKTGRVTLGCNGIWYFSF